MKTMSINVRDMKAKVPTWIDVLKKCCEIPGSAVKSNNQSCILWELKTRIVGFLLLTINCSYKPLKCKI